jgi:hypothetical protein
VGAALQIAEPCEATELRAMAKPVLDFRPHRKGWEQVEASIREAVEKRRKSAHASRKIRTR